MYLIFKSPPKNLSGNRRRYPVDHLETAIITTLMAGILCAAGGVVVKIQNDKAVLNPIIVGKIVDVKYVAQARAYHRRATIEFAEQKNATSFCKVQSDFDIGMEQIAVGRNIRIYQPDPPCSNPYFPDYMTPTWEMPIFSAFFMFVTAILYSCRRYRDSLRMLREKNTNWYD